VEYNTVYLEKKCGGPFDSVFVPFILILYYKRPRKGLFNFFDFFNNYWKCYTSSSNYFRITLSFRQGVRLCHFERSRESVLAYNATKTYAPSRRCAIAKAKAACDRSDIITHHHFFKRNDTVCDHTKTARSIRTGLFYLK
jgi:hypothetical protein